MMRLILICCLSCVLGSRVNFVANGRPGFWNGAISPHQSRSREAQMISDETRMASDKISQNALSMEALLKRLSLKEDVELAANNLFKLIDENSDGQISKSEMKTAYYKRKSPAQTKIWNTLKLNTFKTCMEMVDEADIDGDGKVNLEEFKTFLSQAEDGDEGESDTQASDSDDAASTLNNEALFEMLNLFASIDRDSNGELSMEELKDLADRSSIFRRVFNLDDASNVATFVEDADTDGDGILSFDEFKSYLASSCASEFGQYMDIMLSRKYRPPKRNFSRKIGAQVVILREVNDELQVLVQHHSALGLTTIGGGRERHDENRKTTAMRAIAETGLMDVAALYNDVPIALLRDFEIPKPRFLKIFGETPQYDWWVLLLDGPGVFKKTSVQTEAACEDVSSLFAKSSLPDGSEKADCFGHMWIPVKGLNDLPDSMRIQGGIGGGTFKNRIFQAAVQTNRAKKRDEKDQKYERFIDTTVESELSSFFGASTTR